MNTIQTFFKKYWDIIIILGSFGLALYFGLTLIMPVVLKEDTIAVTEKKSQDMLNLIIDNINQ